MVDIDKLIIALSCLISNNFLYRDVRAHFKNVIDILKLIHVTDKLTNHEEGTEVITRVTISLNILSF